MKFISLFTRMGLIALGFILVAVLNDESVWSEPSSTTPTTSGLVLMAMAMMGAAYLVRDERMENLLWEFGGEEE